jgi:hypothetical protein
VLLDLAARVRAQADELAVLEARNTGKAISDARWEVCSGAACFEYYAGAATQLAGSTPPVDAPGLSLTLRQPWALRADRALELPVPDRVLEARAGARGGQQRGGEARERDPALGAALASWPAADLRRACWRAARSGRRVGRRWSRSGHREGFLHGRFTNGAEILRLGAADIKRTSEAGGKSASVASPTPISRAAWRNPAAVSGNAGRDCCAVGFWSSERSRAFVSVRAEPGARRGRSARHQIGSLIARPPRTRAAPPRSARERAPAAAATYQDSRSQPARS